MSAHDENQHPRGDGGRWTEKRQSAPGPAARLAFHVAPASALDSIGTHGLDHARGDSVYAGLALDYPAGNYLFTDEQAALDYSTMREEEERDEYGPQAESYVVLEVDLDDAGTALLPDPFADDPSGLGRSAVYVTDPIPPSHIRLPGGSTSAT